MSQRILKFLRKLIKHREYYNELSVFPVFDTGDIADIKNKIKEIMDNKNKVDYDELPVVACKYCNNLHIENDEVDNSVCMRCGAVNELTIYKNINEYLEKVEDEKRKTS